MNQPSNVGTNKDNTNPHDDKQRLESHVMFEAGHSHSLAGSVVHGAASLAKQIGMVCGTQQSGQEHGYWSETKML